MAKSYFDLKSGFEQYLALAYGKHIVTGHPVEHAVGLDGNAASGVVSADSRLVLKQALGDGALDVDGEGAWAGPVIHVEGEETCDEADLQPASYPDITNLTLEENGELTKSGGANGAFDANAYSASWGGEHCFEVQFEVSEAKHTQQIAILIEDTDNDVDSRNGWYMTEQLGVPVIGTIRDGAFETAISYEYPLGVRIHGNADGTGSLQLALGGLGNPWGLGTGFDFDTSKSYRLRVAVAGLDGVPVAVAPAVQIAAAGLTGGIEPGNPSGLEVIYAGQTIPDENVHFKPGILSRGKDDPIQGVDTFFPGGLTYNATPSLAVLLPEGIDEDADPSKLAAIVETSQVGDYDEDGNRIAINYSPNPSRVKANMLRRIGQVARLWWASYIDSRDWYNEQIEAPVSTENSYDAFDDVPTYDTIGPITVEVGTGAIDRTSGGGSYDNKAVTRQRIVGGQEGSFRVTLAGAFPTGTGGGDVKFVDQTGTEWFGISWGNGHFSVLANEVAVDKKTLPYDFPAAAGDVIELIIEGGLFKLKQNGVIKTIPQGEAPAPDDVDLFGKVVLWAATAEVSASHFVGQTVAETAVSTQMIPRMEAHPVFTGPVDIGTGLDHVDLLCCSDTQEAGRYIVFLTPERRASSHTFDEQKNIVKGTIKVWLTDIRQRPSRLWAKFRNLFLHYLDEDSTDDKRDKLFDKVGYPIDPGPYSFGPMRPSQAQRNIKFLMKTRSDDKIWCQLEGMDDSWKVVSADVVTVICSELCVRVDDGYDEAATEIALAADHAEMLPDDLPFFARWWNRTDYDDGEFDPNMEIVQVTAIDGDTLTIVRAQEGTDASEKNLGGKIYVLDRYPKDFMVISATRESPEKIPDGMRRVFVLQEYHVNYSDTDHELPQVPIVSRPPSEFAAPPAPVLLLEQRTVESIGGTFVTKIIGTVYFANFPRAQTAKIYVTRPDSTSETYTGIEVTPAAGSNVGTFEYIPDVLGLYTFRAEAWSSVKGGSDSEEILIADLIFDPDTNAFLYNPATGALLLAR